MSSFPEFFDVSGNLEAYPIFLATKSCERSVHDVYFRYDERAIPRLPLTREFWDEASTEDLLKEPHTEVTQRDIEGWITMALGFSGRYGQLEEEEYDLIDRVLERLKVFSFGECDSLKSASGEA